MSCSVASRRTMSYDYQEDYSLTTPVILDRQAKALKASKMIAVLEDAGVLTHARETITVDVGCSAGLLTKAATAHSELVIGFDIDRHAVELAHASRHEHDEFYVLGDSMRLPLADESVDLVLCNHVYEHVPDATVLFAEIHRILKPTGTCYLGAASRLTLIEPHYHLPLLSWLPKPLADVYMRVCGKGDRYYENLRSYWGIKALLSDFNIRDYTLDIVNDPDKFRARDVIPVGSIADRIPLFVWRAVYWLLPSYILLLSK